MAVKKKIVIIIIINERGRFACQARFFNLGMVSWVKGHLVAHTQKTLMPDSSNFCFEV